jgi:hypothetical protein
MAIPVAYQSFKAAGIYRLIYDKSTIPNTGSTNTLRLIVGYSDKGPFNTPVLVSSVSEFTALFGSGSKALEKRGVFFHRMAKECLSTYPCLCLNLKKFSTEHVTGVAIGTDYHYSSSAAATLDYLVTDIYDTTRFWTLDATKLTEINPVTITGDNYKYNTSDLNKKFYINIATTTTANDSCSIFIRKASGSHVSGYNVTVADWYNDSSDEIPEYLKDKLGTRISDYMAEIYVFSGKFTKDQVTASETLGNYFEILNNGGGSGPEVKLKPCVTNAYGDKIDTLQALYEDATSGAVGRYIGSLIPYFKDKTGAYLDLSILFNQDVDTHHLMMSFNTDLLEGVSPVNIELSGVANAKSIDKIFNDGGTGILTNYNIKPNSVYYKYVIDNKTLETSVKITESNPNAVFGSTFSKLQTSMNKAYSFVEQSGYTLPLVATSYIEVPTYIANLISAGDKIYTNGGGFVNVVGTASYTTMMEEYGAVLNKPWPIHKSYYSAVLLDSSVYNDSITFLEENDDSYSYSYLLRVDDAATKEIGYLAPIYLEGYEYKNAKPASTGMKDKLEWQNYQLSAINDYKGIHTALLNKSEIDYRYVVDTFETFIDSEVKSTLSYLCKEKQSAFLLTNFPSINSFLKCPYNDYTDDNGNFNVQYVVDGFNKKKAHTVKFSLPTDANGASYCAFFTCLKSGDGYISSIVPSAAIVSNMFMTKYSTRHPYDIVAGPNYGLITGGDIDGPDYNYSKEELNIIEPFGVNCIVYRPGFGTFINANKTAKQTPVSALSSINVRELCIYLQDEIESILQGYQWEFNNATLRTKIKDKADALCQAVQNNGGLNAYANVCDETNNTPDIIDNEMVVLSTHIEPGRGAGKMVQELTIYRTGGLSSSTSD